eukprot:754872-Hanusia_phi.AAC.6
MDSAGCRPPPCQVLSVRRTVRGILYRVVQVQVAPAESCRDPADSQGPGALPLVGAAPMILLTQ